MRSMVVVLVLALSLLAGCIGGDDDPKVNEDETDKDPEVTETTGSIHGKVIDQGFQEIAGVDMILSSSSGEPLDATLTNSEGMYTFNNLEPAKYRVVADSPCCEVNAVAVEVKAGEVTQTDMELERVRQIETYVNTDGYWDGFVGCAYYVWPGTGSPGCVEYLQDENDDRERTFEADVGLKSIVVAMDWNQNPTSPQERLRHNLFIEIPGEAEIDIVRENARPPILYRVDADPEGSHTDWDEVEEPIKFRMTVGSGGSGATQSPSLVYQQEFTVHYHLFYGEPAEDGYDPRPDA